MQAIGGDWLESLNFSALIWPDYLLLAVVLFSTLISIIRGFLREAISLATWVLAFWVSLTFGHWFADHLVEVIANPMLRTVSAIVILLVATILVGMIVAHCVDRIIKKGKLSGLDRFLGLFFGLARGILIAALLLFLGRVLTLEQTQWWKNSQYIPLLKQPADWLQKTLPDQMQHVYTLIVPQTQAKETMTNAQQASKVISTAEHMT